MFLFTLLFLTLVTSMRINLQSSIIGGIDTAKGFPWMISLRINKIGNELYACSATKISPDFLLTAAHCIHKYKSYITLGNRYDLSRTTQQGKPWILDLI